jgi:small conductance mechanosensitive channel
MNHAGDAVQDVGEVAEGVANALGVDLQTVLHSGLRSLIILVGAWVVYRLFKLVTRRLQQHFDRQIQDERGRRAETIVQLLNSVVGVVIGVAAIRVGVAGLAISFGAQSLVKDVISGFFIIVENQFTVDDIVEINGKAGVVEGMTLRVVMLRDVEGVLHVIPNGSINMVSNRTRDWSRAIVDIGVAYKESVDDVIRVMREVGHEIWEDPDWRPKLVEEPAVWGVEALAESSVNIRIVAGTEPGRQWEVRRELRRRLKNRFDAEGIEIPLPQRTLHVADRASIRESLSNRVRETAP